MEVIREPAAMADWASERRNQVIGLVPTMGFLHDGHASLMRLIRSQVDHLVVSVYVNPLQFGPQEDLDRYPRDAMGDAHTCEGAGADVLFMPSNLYPSGFKTSVSVHGLVDGLCGATRPGHFDGVTTVVARLFHLVGCRIAVFGEKDYQQLMVIRQMVRDLGMPVRIVPGPLVRDADGLALSSRNTYLSASERQRALSLHRALFAMRHSSEREVTTLLSMGRATIDADRIDYLEIVDAVSLEPLSVLDRPARALVAAMYGTTRLIDNVAMGPELRWT